MSFSSLPPELVHQIIESTVPHTFHSNTYHERQRTLCRLSLVSKLFGSIAQPLLLGVVFVNNLEEINTLPLGGTKEGDKLVSGAVGWAVIELGFSDLGELRQEEIENSLRKFSSVTTLTLSSALRRGTIDVAFLSSFLNLGNLHLSGEVWSLKQPLPMPKIHSLTFDYVSDELVASLLRPEILPNLRAFALVDENPLSLPDQRALYHFVPQLQQMSFDLGMWQSPEADFLHSGAESTLIDCDSGYLYEATEPQNQVVHLRIYDRDFPDSLPDDGGFCQRLENFTNRLRDRPSLPLQTIYLDPILSPGSSLPIELSGSMVGLTRTCRERKIDIIFEAVPRKFENDPCLSSKFAARQKEQKVVS